MIEWILCKTYESDYKLEYATEEKDLGLKFTPDLTFSRQVAMAANKANHVVGAMRRSFRYIWMDRWLYNYTSQWLEYTWYLEYAHSAVSH